MMAFTLSGALVSCSDFDDVNNNPMATGGDKVKPYYSLSNSIIAAQATTHQAEQHTMIITVPHTATSLTGSETLTQPSTSLRTHRAHGLRTKRNSTPISCRWHASGAYR